MIHSIFTVDTHTHLGLSSLSGNNNSEEFLIECMDRYGVDASIVLPHACQDLESVAGTHTRIGAFAKKYPKRIFGVLSLNPRLGPETYSAEARRCIVDLGFHGIKLEPQIHAVHVHSAAAKVVFDCARQFHVPVMIHTGAGTFSTPTFVQCVARDYPDVTIVLAHSGMVTYFAEALLVARQCPNVVLESSWSTVMNLDEAIKTISSDRIMMGSDNPLNLPVELAKIDALGLSVEDRANLLGATARRVFNL